jgi:hypothetical protein
MTQKNAANLKFKQYSLGELTAERRTQQQKSAKFVEFWMLALSVV